MFEQLKEFGAAYIIFMVLVVVVFFMDAFVIVNVLTKRKKDLTDYAEFMIKFTKIIMLAAIVTRFSRIGGCLTFNKRGVILFFILVGWLSLAGDKTGIG